MNERNWLLKTGLGIVSFAILAIGAFGWMFRANVVEAASKWDAHLLSPLWPFFAAAAIGCPASQIVIACAGANFHRYSWAQAPAKRIILIAAIIVFAVFATAGSENAWDIATSAQHLATVGARDLERSALIKEIAGLTSQIDTERNRLPDAQVTPSGRQAQARDTFLAATQDARTRLPQARAELAAKPAMSMERERTPLDWWMMAAFLTYQLLEPWLFYTAEGRRREPVAAVQNPAPELTEMLTFQSVAKTPRSRRRAAESPDGAAEIYSMMDRVGV